MVGTLPSTANVAGDQLGACCVGRVRPTCDSRICSGTDTMFREVLIHSVYFPKHPLTPDLPYFLKCSAFLSVTECPSRHGALTTIPLTTRCPCAHSHTRRPDLPHRARPVLPPPQRLPGAMVRLVLLNHHGAGFPHETGARVPHVPDPQIRL